MSGNGNARTNIVVKQLLILLLEHMSTLLNRNLPLYINIMQVAQNVMGQGSLQCRLLRIIEKEENIPCLNGNAFGIIG